MFYRKIAILAILTFSFLLTACTALRSTDSGSPEAMKKSELSKDDLWAQTKTLEEEKAFCQMRLAELAAVVDRTNSRLSAQQNELTLADRQIAELTQTIDDLNTRIKQLLMTGEYDDGPDRIRGLFRAWGAIMRAKGKTNIRTTRSVDSKLRGSLLPGQAVKADFLRDDWYAVFKITETERSEKKALGYVYAPRLFKTSFPGETPEAGKDGTPSASERPAKEPFSVAVKSIRHRVQPGGKEVLLVEFDRFYVPAVYNIEGVAPRIIVDVTRTSSMKKEWSDITTGGALIRKLQVALIPTADILRIVMHMTPDKDYDVKPTIYAGGKSNVYALEVTGVSPPK